MDTKAPLSSLFSLLLALLIYFNMHKEARAETGIATEESNGTRVYHDNYLVVYFYSNTTNCSEKRLYAYLSSTWKYVKETYGPLRPDSPLYVTHYHYKRKNETECTWLYYCDSCRNQTISTVVSCSNEQDSINIDLEPHLTAIGQLVQHAVKGHHFDLNSTLLCGETTPKIVTFDLYVHVRGATDPIVGNWKTREILHSFNDQEINCFRDLILPIYETYGGASVLSRFYSITRTIGPNLENWNDTANVRVGAFIHLWSAAAGQDLHRLAISAFGWSEAYEQQVSQAVTRFPQIVVNYAAYQPFLPGWIWEKQWHGHSEELILIDNDDHVAVYSQDTQLNPTSWSFKTLSSAWNYLKVTYAPFVNFQGSLLFIALHTDTTSECLQPNVISSSNRDLEPENRTVIECSINSAYQSGIITSSIVPKEALLTQMTALALRLAQSGSDSYPAHNISGWSITSILVYDIYMGLGLTGEAQLWMAIKLIGGKDQGFKKTEINWFRDWYFPLYSLHGNTTALKGFWSYLLKYESQAGQGNESQLNMGEFVHFWSGAVGLQLLNLAEVTFQWTAEESKQFFRARKEYKYVSYVFEETNSTNSQPKMFLINESTLGRPQLLKDVYKDDHVTVFFDASIPLATDWPFELLSTFWHYHQLYSNNLLTDQHLNVLFHDKREKGCNYSTSFTVATELGVQELNNTVDCGHKEGSREFMRETIQNLDLVTSTIEPTKESSFRNEAELISATSGSLLFQIVVFDRYLRRGDFANAYSWYNDKANASKIISFGSKHWMWDWFLPIYTKYGGKSVLEKFVHFSEERQLALFKRDGVGSKEMNGGEFVHLWSGAAGISLMDLAIECQWWSEAMQKQFVEARKAYPALVYQCHDCYIMTGLSRNTKGIFEENLLYFIIGILATVVLLGLVGFWIKTRIYKRQIHIMSQQIRRLTRREVEEFRRGVSNVYDTGAHALITSLPFNNKYEVPVERLIINSQRVLGSGEFGLVLEGILKSDPQKYMNSMDVRVAVKTVKPNVEVPYFKALLSEIKIMAFLGPHCNITSLLATCTVNIQNRQVYVALEFCSKGDLQRYLKDQRNKFNNLFPQRIEAKPACTYVNTKPAPRVAFASISRSTSINRYENQEESISTINLLEWSKQIANGMAFLSSKNVIHGDLAARNVLLTSDNTAKISDFGLSRQLVNYSNYLKKSSTPLPWRWLALESLVDMTFSIHSDVWSFGVTLWEIFSLGKLPYPGRTWDHEFVNELAEGERLHSPEFGNADIYNLMLDCMKKEPTERTAFKHIRSQLEQMKVILTNRA